MQEIHDMKPKGRFLQKNSSNNEWEEVSDAIANGKVCQVSIMRLCFYEIWSLSSYSSQYVHIIHIRVLRQKKLLN